MSDVNHGVTGEDTGMPKDEWLSRYRARVFERTNDTVTTDAAMNAMNFDEESDGFEDDPEGAAEEEMSLWDDDEEEADEDDDEDDRHCLGE